ncbi:MAG: indolepyruvate ferredoxin oxidoreductase subunit alpha [Clostridia bacterium]
MGNEAIALGALRAGVGFVSGYPGTPSTEVLETCAKMRPEGLYVEWSINEKAALEAAAGAAYAGVRALVTMKQVGLNVACDPLMSLAYVGVKGGMVVLVADDPGPISSQTEQDTRTFAQYAKLPVFDPSTPEEAYAMIGDAFALSEELGTPVLFRPTTRVCHGCAAIEAPDVLPVLGHGHFEKSPRWVIFPKLSYENHQKIERRNRALSERLSNYAPNRVSGEGRMGIATGGASYGYVREALGEHAPKLLRVATPFPFPEPLAVSFLQSVDRVLVLEELDPCIERALIFLCGKYHLKTEILGKLTDDAPCAGELSVEICERCLSGYLGLSLERARPAIAPPPPLPVRPPVLCAGCPHRASFYAVKRAMKGQRATFSGDIGCYTLGNVKPLDMVDTCLCMGAGITVAQGLARAEPDVAHFAFVGDSTFFASGLTGVVNAVYNGTDIILIVLDNATTAMTGHQPHPGTGRTMMGDRQSKASIPGILTAMGVASVETIDPFDQVAAMDAVKRAVLCAGVRAIIFKAPCIALEKGGVPCQVDASACVGCKKCVSELGCPALFLKGGKAMIDAQLCNGCGLCAGLCPVDAIKGGTHK